MLDAGFRRVRGPHETRVICTGRLSDGTPCGHPRTLERRRDCSVCGAYVFEILPLTREDLPAAFCQLVELTADIIEVDPSPANLAIVRAVVAAHFAYSCMRGEAYPRVPPRPEAPAP